MSNSDLELAKAEIDILKICQHPNIIKIHEIFENKEFFFIVMELCEGGDLFAYLEKKRFRISESEAAEFIHKILAAVYYLHEYGIIHRDLKPENMLLTSKDDFAELKLADFGLSKIIGPKDSCMESFGTLVLLLLITVLCCSRSTAGYAL